MSNLRVVCGWPGGRSRLRWSRSRRSGGSVWTRRSSARRSEPENTKHPSNMWPQGVGDGIVAHPPAAGALDVAMADAAFIKCREQRRVRGRRNRTSGFSARRARGRASARGRCCGVQRQRPLPPRSVGRQTSRETSGVHQVSVGGMMECVGRIAFASRTGGRRQRGVCPEHGARPAQRRYVCKSAFRTTVGEHQERC